MISSGPLMFREFVMNEPLPLATLQMAVLEFLRDKEDVALFGAQAVNAYVDEIRATEDVDVLSPRAADFAEEMRAFLADRFHIAVRVHSVAGGAGHRVYQLRKPKNRHLVEVRPVGVLPPTRRVGGLLVVEPAELIANKVVSAEHRKGSPKSFSDQRDLAVLLLAFPELKTEAGEVRQRLIAAGADAAMLAAWEALVARDIVAEDEDAGY